MVTTCQEKTKPDYGTVELRLKRSLGETTEMIDLCLQRKIIDDRQHFCAMHYRWLHVMHLGTSAPRTTRLDPTPRGVDFDDIKRQAWWQEARQREYNEARDELTRHGLYHVLVNPVIHGERPVFLDRRKLEAAFDNRHLDFEIQDSASRFKAACDVLVKLWGG